MNEVVLPWPPKALSPNARVHWSVRSRSAKQYRMACFLAMREAGIWTIPWDGEIHMWLDFYPPDRRQRDDDNIIAAFKSGRDGIADALKTNDARFRIHPYVKDQIGGMVKVRFTPGP